MARRYGNFVAVGPDSSAGRFMRSFWQPVYVSQSLEVGRAVPLFVSDEEFTLYRGKNGAVGLLGPRCPHRGVLLSVGRVGEDCISCLYHGWTFDRDGQCIDQPAEKKSFAEKVKLPSYPVEEYHGLIFAYLGRGKPPAFPRVDILDSEGTIESYASPRDYPFFNQMENGADEVHFFFTHRGSAFDDAGLNTEIPEIKVEETEYGIVRYGIRGNIVRTSHLLIPNCIYSSIYYGEERGWSDHFAWRVPVDQEKHITFTINRLHRTTAELEAYRREQREKNAAAPPLEPAAQVVAKILKGELHVDDIPARPDLVLIQDAVVMKAQGTAVDRTADQLGISDRQVQLLRRIWTREMKALDDGRPLKKWRVPQEIVVTKGIEGDQG